MANVTIKQEGAYSEVLIDGQKVRCIAGLSVHMDAKSLPRVILDMAPLVAGLELQDATVAIGNLDAPEAVERALLEHLKAKYEPAIRITNTFRVAPAVEEGVYVIGVGYHDIGD